MSRLKKLRIIVPIIAFLFIGAFARHRYLANQIMIPGKLPNKDTREISGMAASGLKGDVYYVHNDSGDTSRFFAISPQGKLYNTIYFKADPNRHQNGVDDCEDIAVGPGPVKDKSYIYIGDIGDNSFNREHITIYRIPESTGLVNGSVKSVDSSPLHLKYPDGAKDTETLMIDPVEKLFYIVTKRSDTVRVYTAPLQYKANDTVTLTYRTKLFFEGVKPFKWITAGDISKDGKQVLIKSYEKVYYWKRKKGEAIWQTLQRSPREMRYEAEKQGEAIAFAPDGEGYYTTSEGVFSPIYYYKTP